MILVAGQHGLDWHTQLECDSFSSASYRASSQHVLDGARRQLPQLLERFYGPELHSKLGLDLLTVEASVGG